MLPIQPAADDNQSLKYSRKSRVDRPGDDSGDEELGAIGVFARVRHAQQARLAVLQFEILIGKLWAVDGFTPST